jgi:hypothetical protein
MLVPVGVEKDSLDDAGSRHGAEVSAQVDRQRSERLQLGREELQ